ncbi:hypothetical protein A2291_05600 [candidate division WOR-1 bacterium RIFOXYB2_FULL_42_35]|uniref:Uncharacterized protein n=1 Tax=candidate division WOR-1 bacterium RIFOXYC2_FULL_41_25 TaxID=1802586 RepID=A0A1F4TNV7_UNCSA|nr:MAG: hypothetical protein A2247_00370 [candidate division WOR-1 bacterium RIFOXYA2_FULL_41_14]OGC24809.1 MAG: hypothetical protein A2291_05600 [candidate division WOR-1 bacterium RIFOXYB2_FULL_42_35]OGC34368.1 MAG: hypothetical protein A2462_07930 [candidate division WOR-1 bacterium RIFOXYC2_FULL_41_25]OGC41581.1 MAG: hypothetical protein A2548_00035 [candidate division WOR-1 bacterium RIFOXYD2_FULL_41_8]
MGKSAKNRWKKPALIVLSRGSRQEAVLSGCKTAGITTGSDGYHDSCYAGEECPIDGRCWSVEGS